MLSPSLRNRFLGSLLFGLVVIAALAVYGDAQAMARTLTSFRWELAPAILALTAVNHLLRFGKWQLYLGRIGAGSLPLGDSVLIFFAGLAMVVTPGKVGELLKCYLVHEATGVPFGRAAPIPLAERMTDGLAMALLAMGGLLVFGIGWQAVVAMFVVFPVLLAGVWYRPFSDAVLDRLERVSFIGARVHHLRQFLVGAQALFAPRLTVAAVIIGLGAWGIQGVAFWLVVLGLGAEANFTTLVAAVFILSATTIGGALLLVPGGLGVAEGGIIGLAQLLLGFGKDAAASSALLVRVCTLWISVVIGVVCLAILARRAATKLPDPSLEAPVR